MSKPNMEEVLKYISKKYVTVNEGEIKDTNPYLAAILENVTIAMKYVSPLFKNMFETYLYAGSSFDGLKVGKPDEYDIDLKLKLPNILNERICSSDHDGFVHVRLKNWDRLTKDQLLYSKFKELEKFKDSDGYLLQNEIKSWMEGIIDKALKIINNGGALSYIKIKPTKSGPAIKLKITYGEKIMFIDLVAVFRITGNKWPGDPVRKNMYSEGTQNLQDYLVVPKPPKFYEPNSEEPRYWRLSFPYQEQKFMKGFYFYKPAIRFLKKLRDETHRCIPSYFIKTIFLWHIVNENHKNNSFGQNSLTDAFLELLVVYKSYFEEKNIPYFWSPGNNFLQPYKKATISDITNFLRNMIKEINRSKDTDPLIVAKYLLTKEEYKDVYEHFNPQELTVANSDNDNVVLGVALAAGAVVVGAAIYALFTSGRNQRRNN